MHLDMVKQLHTGDEVYWVDPNNDKKSRRIRILEIKVTGRTVRITDMNGKIIRARVEDLR